MRRMSLETEQHCPECETDQTFYRTASTTLHLGEKTKWACADCGYAFASVGDITTLSA